MNHNHDSPPEENSDSDPDQTILIKDMEHEASNLLWQLYNSLKRAKFAVVNEGKQFAMHGSEHNEAEGDIEEEKNENNLNNTATLSVPANKMHRRHYGRKRDLDKIDVSAIEVNHQFKVEMFRKVPRECQVLILCPAKMFILIHEKYVRMKNNQLYEKQLFKPLEDNINKILKENFYNEFLRDVTWNPAYNKVINEANQYIINKEKDFNIFKQLAEEKKQIEFRDRKKKAQQARRVRGKESKSMVGRPFRNRRFISISGTTSSLSPDLEMNAHHKAKHHTTKEKNNNRQLNRNRSEIPNANFDDEEEEIITTNVAIREVDSEDDEGTEEIGPNISNHNRTYDYNKRNSSEENKSADDLYKTPNFSKS